MMGLRGGLVVLLLWMISLTAAADKPVVRAAFMNFPGYSYLDESGRAAGKVVELVRLIAGEAGYGVEAQILPAARIWLGLESGEVHLWPGVLNKPDLDEHTLLTERDLGRVGINLYFLPGKAAPDWPQGLRGSSLIMITNFTYTNTLKQIVRDPQLGLVIHKSNSHRGAVEMLRRGRGDYLLDYQAQVEAVLAGLEGVQLQHIQVAKQPMRLVLSRHSGFAEQLKADLDAAVDRLQAQGLELDIARR